MRKPDDGDGDDVVDLTSQGRETAALAVAIVTAYVTHNQIRTAELNELIVSVHATLAGLGNGRTPGILVANAAPAVPVKRSVFEDYIVCLEDGKKLTMLKRYLRSRYNLSPDQYRAKWGLPGDYPMVAPAYAKMRSEFAKKIGLGSKGNPGKPPRKK